MAWLGVVFLASVLGGIQVRVEPVSGQPYEATLEGLSVDRVLLSRSGESLEVPLEQLSRIQRTTSATIAPSPLAVGLVCGSEVRPDSILLDKDQVRLKFPGEDDFAPSVKELVWVRFRAPSPEVEETWRGLIARRRADDLLVIRRSADVLDQVSGVVESIEEGKVSFRRGGSSVSAPINRLEGIVFGGGTEVTEPQLTLTQTNGSVWSLDKFDSGSQEDALLGMLKRGSQRSFALEQIQSIQFVDRTLHLAAEQPVEKLWEPLLSSPLDSALTSKWFAPRIADRRDWVLRSRSSLSFRLDPQYRQLETVVLADPSVSAGTGSLVQIVLDDTVVWEGVVVPGEGARGVQIDLNSARRLTFKVDFGAQEAAGEGGDVVRFIDPRLTP